MRPALQRKKGSFHRSIKLSLVIIVAAIVGFALAGVQPAPVAVATVQSTGDGMCQEQRQTIATVSCRLLSSVREG